jgi:hypothetical protein
MSEPKDMIVPMLREMREEMQTEFRGVRADLSTVNKRLEKIEGRQVSFREAMIADTMMSKFVTGNFEERIGTLEKDVALLKEHQK